MSECGPQCDCKGDLNRRDFLKIGATTAGLLAGAGIGLGRAQAAEEGYIPPECRKPPGTEWFEQLRQSGKPIVYTGEHLRNIIFPLGGIGTGTIWLAGSGRLVNWQIFNNIQKESLVDDTFFAVRVEQDGKPPIVRVLQATGVGSVRGIEDISFCGQYPIATLKFKDDELPIDIELEAFNPLVPLDEQASALPCAIFTIRVKNPTAKPLKVSLLFALQNAVGHNGLGASHGVHHPTYGGNINQLVRETGFTAVAMRAEPGKPARMDPPAEILVDHSNLPLLDDPPIIGLRVAGMGVPKANPAIKSIYWLANGDLKLLGGAMLSIIAEDVKKYGAFLLISGVANPLVEAVIASVPVDATRRETVFATFDGNTYGQWTAEGRAFGRRPSRGTEQGQNPVSGFSGSGLVNSFNGNDDLQGKLLSPEFNIRERYVSFLIGGGQHPGKCCMNLVIDGKVVRSETGENSEQLRRAEWDVNDLVNKDARIEIVDQQVGGWGHILVDDIRFSNLPIDAVTASDAAAWSDIVGPLKEAPPMTPVGNGKGRTMRVSAELGTVRPGTDPITQRDQVLSLIARLAEVDYQPATGSPADAPSFGTMCLARIERSPVTAKTKAAGDSSVDAAVPAPGETRWEDSRQCLASFATRAPLPKSGAGGLVQDLNLVDLLKPSPPSVAGTTLDAQLGDEWNLVPEGSAETTFILAWHFPNQYYPQQSGHPEKAASVAVGNMYANWFNDATAVVRAVVADLENLRRKTYAYRDAMFNTTLPQYLVDAAAANVSILRSPTCFWTKDGTFYGYEGCRGQGGGCCPMNCNHVWNYEQTLAKLWPSLERNMRITELKFNQEANGAIHHRVTVPRDRPGNSQIAVADGQCGAVLKAYREHLQSSDRRFLDDHWPNIKKAMDYAIKAWDIDADGIMDAPQFNTYDRVIFGKNTMISSMYLAALRAAEEMAGLSNDPNAAKRYRNLFDKGRTQIAKTLYDGEYYFQITDNLVGGYGKGCSSDQVIGQWWARIVNLGDILPVEQVRSALSAIFKHNWLWSQGGFLGTQRFRTFADGNDKSLLVCTWPKGGRPVDPILYRDECWTGMEYQVAAHKIYEGQIEEGLTLVRGARERYDGTKKSPWNEIECGDYYARAMSAWSVLLAVQGYRYDGPKRILGFNPRLDPENHRSFFSTADGWGSFSQKRTGNQQLNSLNLATGRCDLAELRLGLPAEARHVTGTAHVGDRPVVGNAMFDNGVAVVQFDGPISVAMGDRLDVELKWSV